jgi:hypothetical protein
MGGTESADILQYRHSSLSQSLCDLSYCEVALLGFPCLGWRWGTQCWLHCVLCSHLCVFPVSPQEILLPPRFRALSHKASAILLQQ